MPPIPDEDLMDAVREGDARAFAALLERHMEAVRAIGWRMLGSADAADDLAQDVFLRIWKRPEGYDRAKGRFAAWLRRVAANACIDRLRKNHPGQLDGKMGEALADPAPGPEQRAIESQRAARVRAAIARLPERQRQAIVLAHDLGHTNIEIAQIMETSVEAVESLLGRARRKLKELLAGELRALGGRHGDGG